MARRSIGFPLTIGIVLTLLALALAVGWQMLVTSDLSPVARGLTTVHWLLLILGTLFFALIVIGLVLLCAWLIREMRHNQRQQAFLDAVTHEMRTPLASLRLYVETLQRHDPQPARRSEFLGRMGADLDRLDHTVDQVLAAARAEERVRHREREPLELRELLEKVATELRSRHALPDDAIRLVAPEPVGAQGVAAELEVVFRNLLDNAVKYSNDNKEIGVKLARENSSVVVSISDHGMGISKEEQEKIFERFHRVSTGLVHDVKGSGLGLAIVNHIVQAHGGQVTVDSEIGKGSTFHIHLPLEEQPLHQPQDHKVTDGARSEMHPMSGIKPSR